jgi:hypothetical protein
MPMVPVQLDYAGVGVPVLSVACAAVAATMMAKFRR